MNAKTFAASRSLDSEGGGSTGAFASVIIGTIAVVMMYFGGSAVIDYKVTSLPGGITATGTSSPITITGLTNGTPYTFTVQAANGIAPLATLTVTLTVRR